jgi:hypothetical protein
MMLISDLAKAVSKKYGVKVLPKHIRAVEARGLIPSPSRLGPFRVYGAEDAARVEEALRATGRLPARPAAEAVA